ncbi:helix-turn-helix transcriptional regulator [Acidithiobacillus sp.]|uniref:helix-turn-helix transcriptional regulator n=1 Tax=Acidithiobacillus sp. TaxID=1872118 RepID=UPI003D0467B4
MTAIDELFDRKGAATFCKISERTLDRQPDLPRVKLTARRIVFRKSDLQAWIERRAAATQAVA